MNLDFKQQFADRWEKYFPGAELPITLYYTDDTNRGEPVTPTNRHRCIICDLAQARKGKSLRFDVDAVGCGGGKRYLGFVHDLRPNFEYFLSCGIPGEMEGERYKKSPALVNEQLKHQPPFEAPGRYVVFKRWDRLDEADAPAVVGFLRQPTCSPACSHWRITTNKTPRR